MNVPVPGIGVAELVSALQGGGVLIDVREPDEYLAAHVPGARLIPLQTVPGAVESFPTGQPVYIICHSGARSHQAAAYLRQFSVDAINVLGGTAHWISTGNATVSGSEPGELE